MPSPMVPHRRFWRVGQDIHSKGAGCLASVAVLGLFAWLSLPVQGAAFEASLKFLISIDQSSIQAPSPARVVLHLHNAGQETVWLYHHARGKLSGPRPRLEDDNTPRSVGSSAIDVNLDPAIPGGLAISKPAQGMAFETVSMPKPKLVRLAPGEDYEEKITIRLAPALSDVQKPLWGKYRLSLVYKAQYSNAEEIRRDLKVTVWQGEAASNAIEVELQPPGQGAGGQIEGRVSTRASAPLRDAIVSLSDGTERLIDQTASDPDGRYAFSGLPPGFYWVTARPDGATDETEVLRHVQLSASQPSVTQDLVLVPSSEIYQAKKMLHKPVLFVVTDSAGDPLDRVGVDATWSNGPVVEDQKGETGDDGAAELDLIPGRSYVTLTRHGCKKQEERADVANGEGIDGFAYTMECVKKKKK